MKIRDIIRRGPREPEYVVPDEEGKLVPYTPTSQRASAALIEYRQALEEARQAATLLYEAEERPACFDHPEWKPERRGPQPRHAPGLCPYCQAGDGKVAATDRMISKAERSPEEIASIEKPQEVVTAGNYKSDDTSEAMRRGYERWKDEQVAGGQVLPNTVAEEQAVHRSNELRRQAMGTSGGIAGTRYEDGRWVVWHHPKRRRRKRPGENPSVRQYSDGEVSVDA